MCLVPASLAGTPGCAYNARADAAANIVSGIQVSRMRGKLIPLASNELFPSLSELNENKCHLLPATSVRVDSAGIPVNSLTARCQNVTAAEFFSVTRTSQRPVNILHTSCATLKPTPCLRYPRRTKNSATSQISASPETCDPYA